MFFLLKSFGVIFWQLTLSIYNLIILPNNKMLSSYNFFKVSIKFVPKEA